jgi:AcrR family transcriptional regulator
MARSFTEAEKEDIRKKLIAECEKSWAAFGYKKTNVSELCAKAGISTGAFYMFFDSKETLFCNVIDYLQQQIILLIDESLSIPPSKEEICQVLKQMYLEYDRTNILTQNNSPDFIAFWNRAPKEWKEKHLMISDEYLANTIFGSNVKMKMSKEKALGILGALMTIITNKDILGYDHFEIFCTLLDSVINEIYE